MRFKEARENMKLTQAEAAKALHVDQSAISLWETGKTAPRASLLVKVANLYCCTVDELLKEE